MPFPVSAHKDWGRGMKEHKYKFRSYWKYGFTLDLENGKTIVNENQRSNDIYRLGIEKEGIAVEQEDGSYLVDGVEFI